MTKRLAAFIVLGVGTFPYSIALGFWILPAIFNISDGETINDAAAVTAIVSGVLYAIVTLTVFLWALDFYPIRDALGVK